MALKRCQRCGSPFTCSGDKDCWCEKSQIHRRELITIMERYNDCICPECLSLYERE